MGAYRWLIRFRARSRFDGRLFERGPFGTWSLRVPILGRILRVERTLRRWL